MKTTDQHLFTKSRFKIALECPTKLYYLDLKDEQGNLIYKNRMSDDPFIQAKFVYSPSTRRI